MDEHDDTPRGYQRPRSKHKFVDMLLDMAFSFTGPAQATRDDAPVRGPRTDEEAQAGFGEYARVTVDGKTYLVRR